MRIWACRSAGALQWEKKTEWGKINKHAAKRRSVHCSLQMHYKTIRNWKFNTKNQKNTSQSYGKKTPMLMKNIDMMCYRYNLS